MALNDNLYFTRKFLGRSAFFWVCASVIGGSMMGIIDFVMAAFLQLLVRALGITNLDVSGLGFVSAWVPSVIELVGLLLVVGILRAVCQFLIIQSATISKETVNARLRLAAIYRMLQKPLDSPMSASEMNYWVGEVFPKAANFFFYLALIIPVALQIALLTGIMFWQAWRETTFGLIGLLIAGVISMRLNKWIYESSAQTLDEQRTLVGGIERVARNWLLVRVLRTNQKEYDALQNNIMAYGSHSIRAGFMTSLAAVLPSTLGVLLLVGIIYFSLNDWKTPGMQFVAFLYLFLRLVQNLGVIGQNTGGLIACFPPFHQSLKILKTLNRKEINEAVLPAVFGSGWQNIPSPSPTLERVTVAAKASDKFAPPKIEVKNLTFGYQINSPILKNLNFAAAPGQQLGIIGRSGTGKSTLLGLILGVLKANSGEVNIDRENVEAFYKRETTDVGFVGPEPFLIEGSLKANLTYGLKNPVPTEEILESLEMARLKSFVQELPGGLDYQLLENGDGLSAGQKQRLALARAFLRKPKLLVLDEVSANLDDVTEAEIAESIVRLKGKCTVIIVSHRAGMLKYCDQVLDFSKIDKPVESTP